MNGYLLAAIARRSLVLARLRRRGREVSARSGSRTGTILFYVMSLLLHAALAPSATLVKRGQCPSIRSCPLWDGPGRLGLRRRSSSGPVAQRPG